MYQIFNSKCKKCLNVCIKLVFDNNIINEFLIEDPLKIEIVVFKTNRLNNVKN